MNIRQECYTLIDSFSDEQLRSIVMFFKDMQHIQEEMEEELDMAFCVALARSHDKCADKHEPGISIEELAEQLGIDLEAEYDED